MHTAGEEREQENEEMVMRGRVSDEMEWRRKSTIKDKT
jgi:hypothetical protein